jgi:PBSX family phage portal protein
MDEVATVPAAADTAGASFAFSFGDPEPVIKERLPDYLGLFSDAQWGYFLPPVSLPGLAATLNANAHHGAIIRFKRNMLARWFRPSPALSLLEFRKAALDWHVFGMAYFFATRNRLDQVIRLERRPALKMRRGVVPGTFFELSSPYDFGGKPTEYRPGEIIQIKEDDVAQEVYGIPEWFGGLQSILLSEDVTLFRRRFFLNGAHVGYILVTTDAGIDTDTAAMIEAKVKEAKGPGNFRNLYLNIPRSTSREPVKVVPVGDIATKDDLVSIKQIMESEALAMHRMQPGISGVIPRNITGFGDLEKVAKVYLTFEVPPMQQPFLALNDVLPPAGRISFDDPAWA